MGANSCTLPIEYAFKLVYNTDNETSKGDYENDTNRNQQSNRNNTESIRKRRDDRRVEQDVSRRNDHKRTSDSKFRRYQQIVETLL